MADLSQTFAAINARRPAIVKAVSWLATSIALIAAAPASAASDTPHQALARQVVDVVFSATTFEGQSVKVAEFSAKIIALQVALAADKGAPDPAPMPPVVELKAEPLHHSLNLAAASLTQRYEDKVADAYARHFNDAELQGMLAFLQSPDGQASIANRVAYAAKSDGTPESTQTPYVETAAERAFDATGPGRAIKGQQQAISAEMDLVVSGMWPDAMTLAQADYCAHAPCGDTERAIFAGLAKIWDPSPAEAGH